MKYPAILAPLALGLLSSSELFAQATYSVGERTTSTLTLSTTIIASGPYAGTLSLYAGSISTAGAGNVLAAGQSLNRADYSELFAAIGTTYGSESATTFTVPNLAGKTILGSNSGLGTTTSDSINLRYAISLFGVYPNPGSPGANTGLTPAYVGQIVATTASTLPAGWMDADGRLLPISENEVLFNLIGTTYGGDGEENFALPNLTGRAPIGNSASNQFGVSTSDTLPIAFAISLDGTLAVDSPSGATQTFLGEVHMFSSFGLPTSMIYSNGQLLQISQYETLFSRLGTAYGGDGETLFGLPNFRDVTFISATQFAASVPEPSSTALLAGAGVLVGALASRRRRSALV